MRLVYSLMLLPLSLLFSAIPKIALADTQTGQVATVQEIAAVVGRCFYCGAIDMFLQGSSQYLQSNGSGSPLISQSDALTILGISLGLWLLFHTMKTAFQVTGGYREYFLGIVQRFFAVIVAAGFISTGFTSLSEVVIEPTIEFSAAIGLQLLASNHGGGETVSQASCGLSTYAPVYSAGTLVNVTPVETTGFFSKSFTEAIGCLVKEMDANIMPGRVVAATILSYVTADKNRGMGGMISFTLFFAGFLLMIPYIYLTIFVPFLLMDPLLKIVMVGILFPLFVIAWVFPSTRGYSKKGFELLMFACMELLSLSFIIGMLTRAIKDMLDSIDIYHYVEKGFGFSVYEKQAGSKTSLYELLNGGSTNIDAFDLSYSFANWNNIVMFKVLVASLLLCYIIKRSQHLAELLANDSFSQLNTGSVLAGKMKSPVPLVQSVVSVSTGVATAPFRGAATIVRTARRTNSAYKGTKMVARKTYAAGKGAVALGRSAASSARNYYQSKASGASGGSGRGGTGGGGGNTA